MSIREPEQMGFDLQPVPDLPAPRSRVDAMKAAAQDGDEWEARLERVYDAMARMRPEGFYPSELRATAAAMGLGDPPHGSTAWGRVAARMRDRGWRVEIVPQTSRTESRNRATEFRLWMPPPGATT